MYMNENIKKMSFEEFTSYCNENACNGGWSMEEALTCIEIMKRLTKIEVKILGFRSKKRTKYAREEEWEKIKLELF